MSKTTFLAALAAGLVAASAAHAADATYDENANWLAGFGATTQHLTDAGEMSETAVGSLNNAVENAQDPDALNQGPYQLHQWPWNGDPDREPCGREALVPIAAEGCYAGRTQRVSFDNGAGLTLDGTVFHPDSDTLRDAEGRVPGVVISDGFQGNQKMYWWAAQGLAEAGYLVMTYDVSGQGHSQGSATGDAAAELHEAVDYFIGAERDWADELQAGNVGMAGHSMGAGAVQSVGNANRPEINAIVAWSDLGPGYTGDAPIQGQGADYDNWIFPPVPSEDGPDSEAKLDGFDAVRGRGVDVQEVVIESASHLAWSHVDGAWTSTWSEEVAAFYTLAWFDRYLGDDFPREGVSATERLVSNYEAREAPGHGLSRKYLSAYSIGADLCRDQRDREGC
ncbi:MAG: alpha/beta hydrolase [Thermoleophilaceae bacterium]